MRHHSGTFHAFWGTLVVSAFLALTLSSCAVTVAMPGSSAGTPTLPATRPSTPAASQPTQPDESTKEKTNGAKKDEETKEEPETPTEGKEEEKEPETPQPEPEPEEPKEPETPAQPKPGENMTVPTGYNATWDSDEKGLILKRYVVPNGVQEIELPTDGPYAIGQYSISAQTISHPISVKIPNQVTQIGKGAFQSVWIKEVDIPNSVTKIEAEAFQGTKLQTLTFTWNHEEKDLGAKIFSSCDELKDITIKGDISALPTEMFAFCTGLQTVSLPNGLKTIGAKAFSGAGAEEGMTMILPQSIEKIDENAFANASIKALYLPTDVTLDENAFSMANIEKVYFAGNQDQWNELSNEDLMWLDDDQVKFNQKPSDVPASSPAPQFLLSLFSLFF